MLLMLYVGLFKVITTLNLDSKLLCSSGTSGAPFPAFFGDSTPTSTVTSSSDSSSLYTFTAQSGPLPLMQHSHSTLTFKPLILFRPLCIFSFCTLTTASCSWLFLYTSCFLFPSLTSQGSSMECWGSLPSTKLYTLFRLITLI